MADPNKYKISIGIIEELKRKGLNGQQIADMFNITKQAVSYHKVTYNGSRTPREVVNENFPWKVPEAMNQSSPYKRLRDHGEYMATGGEGMNEDKLKRLRSFYKKLRDNDWVIEFDPDLPPEKGVSSSGGFAFRARRPKDGDLIIRVNKYTRLTQEGLMIWRFPPVDP